MRLFHRFRLNSSEEGRFSKQRGKSALIGFADGIGRWGISQKEVVLELNSLEPASVYSYGGYSASRETLAALQFKREPTPEDMVTFDTLMAKAGVAPGPWWLSPEGTREILERMEPEIVRLREREARESS
jgi:hypothetical protein